MTWRWHICSRNIGPAAPGLLLILTLVPRLDASTVTGRVNLAASRDPNVRKHKDYSGVVVWLEPAGGLARMPERFRAGRVEMVQKHKSFRPHVLAIPVGASVSFPNFDPIFHNAFSRFDGKIFDVGLYPPGTSKTVNFTRPGIVRVFCNIHPTMSAVIVVLDTPYFGATSPGGDFRISGVPPGTYQLRVFHERATRNALESLERRIAVTGATLELPPMTISESEYILLPHKNKFGKDYPPEIDSPTGYPGSKP